MLEDAVLQFMLSNTNRQYWKSRTIALRLEKSVWDINHALHRLEETGKIVRIKQNNNCIIYKVRK